MKEKEIAQELDTEDDSATKRAKYASFFRQVRVRFSLLLIRTLFFKVLLKFVNLLII